MSQQVERITFKHLSAELIKIFNLEKGILLTVRDLLLHPRTMIKQYLVGGEARKKYTKPLQFVIVLVGLYTFLMVQIDWSLFLPDTAATETYDLGYKIGSGGEAPDEATLKEIEAQTLAFQEQYNLVLKKYFNVIMLAFVPLVALFTYLFYRKHQLSYPEHLVVNAYLTGVQSVIYIVTLPLIFLSGTIFLLSSLVAYLYNIWFYQQCFNQDNGRGWFKAFWVTVLTVSASMLLTALIAAVVAVIQLT